MMIYETKARYTTKPRRKNIERKTSYVLMKTLSKLKV